MSAVAIKPATTCPACRDTGLVEHEKGTLPCPYCNPAGARKAASS